MSFDPKVINALAELRQYAAKYPTMGLSGRINALDNAGVFAALDEQTGYASAVEILAEGAAIDMVRRSNPNVPADRALQVLHNTWHPERAEVEPTRHQVQDVNRGSDYGLTEEEGRRAGLGSALPPRHALPGGVSRLGKLERVPGTDTLRPARQTAPCSCGGVGSGCTCD